MYINLQFSHEYAFKKQRFSVREEQNLYPLQLDKNIYYLVIRKIRRDEELLIWYGNVYARNMGLKFTEEPGLTGKALIGLAPRKSFVKI